MLEFPADRGQGVEDEAVPHVGPVPYGGVKEAQSRDLAEVVPVVAGAPEPARHRVGHAQVLHDEFGGGQSGGAFKGCRRRGWGGSGSRGWLLPVCS